MKLLIFATPRSGSTYLYSLIQEYMSIKYGAILGWEYFHVPVETSKETKVMKRNELFNDLQSSKKPIFIKVFPRHVTNIIFNYLNDNYQFILLDRANKFDQFLSGAIARNTGVWACPSLQHLADYTSILEKVDIPHERFEIYGREIGTYYFACNYVKNVFARFTYETLITRTPVDVLCELFPNDKDLIQTLDIYLPYRMNPRNKLKYVNNADELTSWFRTVDYKSRITEAELFDTNNAKHM